MNIKVTIAARSVCPSRPCEAWIKSTDKFEFTKNGIKIEGVIVLPTVFAVKYLPYCEMLLIKIFFY